MKMGFLATFGLRLSTARVAPQSAQKKGSSQISGKEGLDGIG
jgi:hypothetical protein